VGRLLAEHLGPALIEDLPRNFFCVAADLTRAEEVIHERGPLWPTVRASYLAVLKGNLRPSSHLHRILDATGGDPKSSSV
jgi:NTE family protein